MIDVKVKKASQSACLLNIEKLVEQRGGEPLTSALRIR
jgi:hypothetical protein